MPRIGRRTLCRAGASPSGGGSNPTLAKQTKLLFDLEHSYILSTACVDDPKQFLFNYFQLCM